MKLDSHIISILLDDIVTNSIKFNVGDKIKVFRRKANGHPVRLKDDIEYVVRSIERDFLSVGQISKYSSVCKVNKRFVLPMNIYLSVIRDEKLELILNEES